MFNVIILGIASFLTDVSTEMVYPLLPLYLTSARIGATPAIVGLIEGFSESIASLLRVFSGAWSDRWQRRKPIAIGGYAFSTLGKVLLYFSMSWQIVFAGRLSDRFGKGVRTAPRDALIADSTTEQNRGNAFGLHRALDTAGASLGVILAYLLFVSNHTEFGTIFLWSLVPAGLGVLALFLVREKIAPRAAPQKKKEPWWTNLGTHWHALDRRLKVFLVIIFIFALGNSSNQFLLLRANDLGFDTATTILMYLVFNVVYSLGSWPLGRLSDRVGRKRLLVLGYLTYGVVYFGFAIASPLALWGLFATYGLYYALTEGVEKALVSDIAPAGMRATLIGLHATFVGVGLLPASLLAGWLWNAFGASAPFYFGGGMGIVAAIALWLLI
ncbi:MAG: MFS transporter [Chloroflexi bacterium]|nr:MFS transporter [Chloroflexota bacterium]